MDHPFADPFDDVEPLFQSEQACEQASALALARLIAERRGVALEDLQPSGSRRRGRMGEKRHAALAELCTALRAEPYRWSYPQVGKFVGRDHTTVMYAVGAIRK
jgi:chromosomal replication initiation ATPase DnaA